MANNVVGAYCRRVRLKDETIIKSVLDSKGKVISHPVCDDVQINCPKCLEAVSKAKEILDEQRRIKKEELDRKTIEKALLELREEEERLRKEKEKKEQRMKECTDYCPNCGENCAIFDVKRWYLTMHRSEEEGFIFKKKKNFSRKVYFCSDDCAQKWQRNNRGLTIDGHSWSI